ncbi:hypothetical protein QE397_002629 [Rhodococcus sp. SORGH_AS 301]|nr:hypothetical protein [Rhodococcus sp. SORGH_AS_0301]
MATNWRSVSRPERQMMPAPTTAAATARAVASIGAMPGKNRPGTTQPAPSDRAEPVIAAPIAIDRMSSTCRAGVSRGDSVSDVRAPRCALSMCGVTRAPRSPSPVIRRRLTSTVYPVNVPTGTVPSRRSGARLAVRPRARDHREHAVGAVVTLSGHPDSNSTEPKTVARFDVSRRRRYIFLTIQSDRETWLVDVAATRLEFECVGATARTDGGDPPMNTVTSRRPHVLRLHLESCRECCCACTRR